MENSGMTTAQAIFWAVMTFNLLLNLLTAVALIYLGYTGLRSLRKASELVDIARGYMNLTRSEATGVRRDVRSAVAEMKDAAHVASGTNLSPSKPSAGVDDSDEHTIMGG